MKIVVDSAKYVEVRVIADHTHVLAQIGFAPGKEYYVALLLHELVASGKLDARIVQHWFDLCAKGEEPKVEREP